MGKNPTEFDKCIDRFDTGSIKYDKYKGKDIIPMWVADTDFRSPEPVIDALRKRVNHGVFGYASVPDELKSVIVEKLKLDYGWIVSPRSIVAIPSLVIGLNLACRCAGNDGDEAVVFTPIYPPFLKTPVHSKRRLVDVPLLCRSDFYTIDMQAFKKAITAKTKTLLFCNPHNPVGRMYNKEELQAVAKYIKGSPESWMWPG